MSITIFEGRHILTSLDLVEVVVPIRYYFAHHLYVLAGSFLGHTEEVFACIGTH